MTEKNTANRSMDTIKATSPISALTERNFPTAQQDAAVPVFLGDLFLVAVRVAGVGADPDEAVGDHRRRERAGAEVGLPRDVPPRSLLLAKGELEIG